MKGFFVGSSMFISLTILLFNGTFGYFILTSVYGDPKGVYVFITLSSVAIAASFIPLFMKLRAFRFYYRVLLYANVVVIFYPLFYKIIAEQIISRLL